MRKTGFIFLALAALLGLSACDTPLFTPDINKGYELNAHIRYSAENLEATAVLTRQNENVWSAKFTEPYALSGVELTGNTLKYGGIAIPLGQTLSGVGTVIFAAFEDAAAGTDVRVAKSGDAVAFSGAGYVLKIDRNSGLPVTLSIPKEHIEVTFTDGRTLPFQSPEISSDAYAAWESDITFLD